jgi:protein TonB
MTLIVLLALIIGQTGTAGPSSQPVYLPGDGVTLPRVVSDVKPQYTPDAMRAKISGSILLEAVVQADGTVSDIHLVRSLDPGLDQAAISALQNWFFSPGLKDGEPVAVRITVQMTFVLGGGVRRDASIVVLSRAEPDGTRTLFEISEERFRRQPAWEPAHSGTVPLSLEHAIHIAMKWVNTNHSPGSYRLADAGIARVGGRDSVRWYYRVNFARVAADNSLTSDVVTAIVLLDGSLVEPRVQQQR